jgi:hypothetical protein
MEQADSADRSESSSGSRDAGEAGPSVNRPALVLVIFLLGCHSDGSVDVVRQYARLAVALGEHDPNSLDYYYGPVDWVADVRAKVPKLAEIKQSALELAAKLKTSGEPQRDYLIAQLQSIVTRVDLLQGVRLEFTREARDLFRLEVPGVMDEASLEAARRDLDQLLPGKGSPAQRYAAFDHQFVIPEDKVATVFEQSLQACRERTLRHLPLPAGESAKIEYVVDRPWNAYSRYQGHYHSLIQVNADFALTVDRALALACHEGYPGHHAYNTLQDAQLVQHEGRKELMVQPAFSPQSLVSEALATYAVEVAFPGDERLAFERDVLLPLMGLHHADIEKYLRVNRLVDQLAMEEPAIARDYLDGKLEWARAASALEDRGLMAHTDATIKYLNEFRTYMLTYTIGAEQAAKCMAGAKDPWTRYRQLMLWKASFQNCGAGE